MLKKGSKSSLCGSQAQDLKREDSEGLRCPMKGQSL